MFQLAPSILAANPWSMGPQVEAALRGGATVLHIDVMDGHFVPNLTMGPDMVKALKKETNATLDVHLMVEDPDFFIAPFAAAGADWISFHIEASAHSHRICQKIHKAGCKAGIAINPGTPITHLEAILESVDFILLMSVNPGFGGQDFIETTYDRIEGLVNMVKDLKSPPFIQVDGGIGSDNIRALHKAGMQVAVAGSSVFGKASPEQAAKDLISAAGV